MYFYKNLNGNSGISRYQITQTSVLVEFRDGKVYEYSCESAGSANIEKMKVLALAGSGLNSFIMRNVKLLYVK